MKLPAFRHSLTFKIIAVQSLGLGLILIATGVIQYGKIRDTVYREIVTTGGGIGRAFCETLTEHPHLLATKDLQNIILRFNEKLHGIERVSIIDKNLRIIADSEVRKVGQITDQNTLVNLFKNPEIIEFFYVRGQNKYLRLSYPITGEYDLALKSAVIGAFSFDIRLSFAEAKIRRDLFFTLVTLTSMLLIFWGGQYLLIRRFVLGRLEKAARAAESLGRGDYRARADSTGQDEIAALGGAFNKMAALLEESRRALLKYADDLEKEIAQRTRLEAQQAELIGLLDRSNRELESFAYIVSHDLKAPLRAITSLANWLAADYADQIDSAGKESLQLLVQRARRMSALIDGILQYSRVGRIKEERESVDLREVVGEVIDLLGLPDRIALQVETALPVVRGGKTRLIQVFQNLIVNAVKHAATPEVRLRLGCLDFAPAATSGGAAGEKGFCTCYVADNGPGIEERYFEKIFQIFQTLQARDEVENTGVGLAIVKKIIEMNGGRIWVESKVGEGATFWFTLPQAGVSK
ncbi:MAG: ATP-binding protein [Smithellaceae bacterium]|nr:ATP-binding protein [Smithellaceae bacterium]